MKIISWNINGLRSFFKKKYLNELLQKYNPDILCLSETKLNKNIDIKIIEANIDNISNNLYKYKYWNISDKGGYSGTAIFMKKKPLNIVLGLEYENKNIDNEGRIILIEYKKYYLINVYTPNSGIGLNRLEWRTKIWDRAFEKYIDKLQQLKPVIICGDLNVARTEIDLKNPTKNLHTAGYTIEERESFELLIKNLKLIDIFRNLYPDKIQYTYWTYKFKARENNIGWRIDYFLLSHKLIKKIKECSIIDMLGSDHAPIQLIL